MKTATIQLPTSDGPMDLYEAIPDGPARGAVIVVQEAFGVNDYIRDVARRFAAEGYHAVAPTLYHRTGIGEAPYSDLSQVMPLFWSINDDTILIDVDATIEHLRGHGFADKSIGIIGFCQGGRVSFLVAARRNIGAGICMYGAGIERPSKLYPVPLVDECSLLQAPWLGFFGGADKGIPADSLDKLREALKAAPVDSEIIWYPEADHGFHCDAREVYHEPSAHDAWRRTLKWYATHLSAKE